MAECAGTPRCECSHSVHREELVSLVLQEYVLTAVMHRLCCRIVMSSRTQRNLFPLALCLKAGISSLSLLWPFSHRITHGGCMLSPAACFSAACHSEYLLGLQACVRVGYNWPIDSKLIREGLADVFIHR